MTDKNSLSDKNGIQRGPGRIFFGLSKLLLAMVLMGCSSTPQKMSEEKLQTSKMASQRLGGNVLTAAALDTTFYGTNHLLKVAGTSNAAKGAAGKGNAPWYVRDEVLAVFHKGAGHKSAGEIAHGNAMKIVRRYDALSRVTGKAFVLLAPSDEKRGENINTLCESLKDHPSVKAVSPNRAGRIIGVPNDAEFYYQWGMHNTEQLVNATVDADIDAPEAWDIGTGSSAIVIAVLDTGIDYLHEDLIGNMWVNAQEYSGTDGVDDDGNGYVDDVYGIDPAGDDGTQPDADPMDTYGHGTHCAGIIGATGNNSVGVAGVNWDVQLMALKLSPDFEGVVVYDAVIESLDYVVDQVTRYSQNVVAINASWKLGADEDEVLGQALAAAGDVGIVVVAGAGNDGENNDSVPVYPASYDLPNVLAVAATDDNDTLADFSNYGASSVDLAAPGVLIESTVPRKYLAEMGDIFFDDLESGMDNWETGGVNNDWAISSDHEAFSVPSGGIYFLSDSPGKNYSADTNSWVAINHDVDLSSYAAQDVYLGAIVAFQIELLPYDKLYVELSNDGGLSWDELVFFSGGADWTSLSWRIPEIYKTAQFRFRFHLESDLNTQYLGWLIDDVGIGTTVVSSYDYMDGTSMAAPHVAGAVGLMAAVYPFETVTQRRARILDNVDIPGTLYGRCASQGRLNLFKSISANTVCENDADCDDGLHCNGVENCNLFSGECAAGTAPCEMDDGLFCNGVEGCDEAADECLPAALPCAADDGLFCNGEEGCDESTDACLTVTPPCADDDGIFCNGIEVCDETSDACGHSGNPCAEAAACNETRKQCVGDCTGCGIEDICYKDGDSNPLNSCEVCDILVAATMWTVFGDSTTCDDGNPCTEDDVCASGQCQGDSVADWTECGDGPNACLGGECVELPLGDICTNPIALELDTTFDGDFSDKHAYLDVADSCGQGPFSGVDVFFEINLFAGEMYEVTVAPQGDADVAVSVLLDCDGECIGAVDNENGGEKEVAEPFSVAEDALVLIHVVDVTEKETSDARFTITVRQVDDEPRVRTDVGADDDTETSTDSESSVVEDSETESLGWSDDNTETANSDILANAQSASDDAGSQSGCGCQATGRTVSGGVSLFKLVGTLL